VTAEPTAIRPVTGLPDFFALVGDDWHPDLMDTACTLMDTPGLGLLRVSPEVVVAFRYRDVRELSVTREAGNMPIEALAGQSTRRETRGLVTRGSIRPGNSGRSS